MKRHCLIVPVLATASALLLSSCGMLAPWTAEPAPQVQPQVATPSYLDLGRDAFSRGNYGIAIRQLELELAQHPASTSALNGLGASYDQLGRHDVALRYYYKALALAPESAATLNNIGYSYILQGKRAEALRYLDLALARNPEQRAALSNRRRALALDEFAVSDTGERDHILVPDPEPNATAGVPITPTLPAAVRIEVSNGNGVSGMAALLRASLRQQGANVVRLTNADNYAYSRSIVYYRAGLHDAAIALAARLPASRVELVESQSLVDRVDLRLLIGRDLIGAVDTARGVALAQQDSH